MPTPIRPTQNKSSALVRNQAAVYGGPSGVPAGARSRALPEIFEEIETFESGSNGAAYTATSGLSDGGANGTGTMNYVSSFFVEGALGCQVAITTSSSFERQFQFGATIEAGYAAMSFQFDTLPSAGAVIGSLRSGVTNLAQIRVTSTGTLQLRNNVTAVVTSTTTLSVNTTYTVELAWDSGAQTMTGRIWDNFGNLVEQLGSGAFNTGVPDLLAWGVVSAPGAACNWFFDRVGYSNNSWLNALNNSVAISASETLTFTDVAGAISASFTATETLAMSDVTSAQSAVFSATENLALADAFSALAATVSDAETLTLTDVVDTLNTGGGGPTPISDSDTLTLTDSVSVLAVSLSAAETLSFLDAVGARSATLSATETLSLADAAGQTALSAAETLTLLDQTLRVDLSASEVLALADARGTTALSASETLSFTEAYTDRTLSDVEFLLLNDGVGSLVKTGGPGIVLMLLPYRRRPRRNTYGVANTREAP